MALTGNETLLVRGQSAPGIPSGEQFQTTTRAIADLGGGGGGGGPGRAISSGTMDIADTSDNWIGWASSTSGPKTQIIPTSTGSGQELTIADCTYTVETVGEIDISPQSGTINGQASVSIRTNGDSRTIKDTVIGWRMM